ncbi:MAG: radical SAM protein, partial [Bdellovibrionota bacterium]
MNYTPMSIVIYLTRRCNYRCSFCYAKDVLDNHAHDSDLTHEQLRKVLESPFGKNALRVGLLGGEPFLNSNIFAFIDTIKAHRKIMTVVTNASLLDDEKIKRLLKTRLDVLGVSLYDNNLRHVERVGRALRGKQKYWIQSIVSASQLNKAEELIRFALEIGCENIQLSN